ncbi:uncharacterized protein LOC110901905 [Helianthus annuus]|uniref:uncharacterized protein LOC110901905 n=1 Tax=Helianthus annuus TaxID=4232 RepID=UPI000B902EDA|nr:uncharacterized protein LOC110901905 [Helianthus annuus]
MPDEEEMPCFEPSVPFDYEEVTTGLGFKWDSSSSTSSEGIDTSTLANQSAPVIEDYDSSDDELDQQPIAAKGKQPAQRAQRPNVSKSKFETKGARYQKKNSDVKFVASKGTDKIETFDKRTVKEQETKQRRQNVKAVEKALKSEVKSVNREPSSSQSLKPEVSKSFQKNQTDETPNFRVWNLATKKIELWSEVRVQRYTSPVRAPGDPWMFDYDGLLDSFSLPTFDEASAAARMLLESDNAADSPLVRLIVLDPQASTSVNNNTVQNEEFEDATDFNESSEDDEYHDANEGTSAPVAPVQGAFEATPHEQNVDTTEGNASTSTPIPGLDLVVDLNLNNLGINTRVPDVPESRIHDTHPHQNIIGDVHRGVQTRMQLRNN